MKAAVKKIISALPFAVTKNEKYDRLTKRIIKKVCTFNSNTIDIGCHKGEILDEILKISFGGKHFGIEPLPDFYKLLKTKYSNPNISILNLACSDKNGTSTFQFVKSNPAYSGLKKRDYKRKDEVIEEIEVETKRLDDLIPENLEISLIKIDVEGGEYNVLTGAENIIKKSKPVIIFEHGKGGAKHYGTNPESMFELLNQQYGLSISLLDDWLAKKPPLEKLDFCEEFNSESNYYFVAHS